MDTVTAAQAPLASNVYDGTTYRVAVCQAANYLFTRLAAHCGPFAQNALVPMVDPSFRSNVEHVFLKDGIKIVDNIRFPDDLVAEHVRMMTSYLGRRIDSACHDGTTTSMMVFAGLAAATYDVDGKSPQEVEAAFAEVFNRMETALEFCAITVPELAKQFNLPEIEARRFVATYQALISSKGDAELARELAEVAIANPVRKYGFAALRQAEVETDRRFEAVVHEYDFKFKAQLLNNRDRNHMLSTEYLGEDVTLFISEDELNPGNTEYDWLVRHILAACQKAQPIAEPDMLAPVAEVMETDFVILAPHIGPDIDAAIHKYNAIPGIKGKFIAIQQIINFKASGRGDLVVRAVQASAGKPRMRESMTNPEAALIRNAYVAQRFDDIFIGRLYERDGGVYHPFYADETKYPPYNKLVRELEALLDKMTKGADAARFHQPDVYGTIDLYRALVSQRLVDLRIGGTVHELRANVEVARDALGAVMSALEDGFIMGGIARMLEAVKVTTHAKADTIGVTHATIGVLGKILDTIYNINTNGHYPFPAGCSKYAHHTLVKQPGHTDFIDLLERYLAAEGTQSLFDVVRKAEQEDGMTILIQPVVGYRELLKRLRELIPKMATTVCFVDSTSTL